MTLDQSTQRQHPNDLIVERARKFRNLHYDPAMERWLQVREENPNLFAATHPMVQDRVQIYSDIRIPYTEALAAGLLAEDA